MEPKRKGYGSRIYWDPLSHEMRGGVDFEFAPDVFVAASNSPQGRSSKRSSDFVGPWGGETCDNVCQSCSAILAVDEGARLGRLRGESPPCLFGSARHAVS